MNIIINNEKSGQEFEKMQGECMGGFGGWRGKEQMLILNYYLKNK